MRGSQAASRFIAASEAPDLFGEDRLAVDQRLNQTQSEIVPLASSVIYLVTDQMKGSSDKVYKLAFG